MQAVTLVSLPGRRSESVAAVADLYLAKIPPIMLAPDTSIALFVWVPVCTRDGTVSAQYAAMIGILCSVGCLVIGAVMAVYWMKNRVRKHQKREKRRAEVRLVLLMSLAAGQHQQQHALE